VDSTPIDHVLALDHNQPELVKQFRKRQADSSAQANNETFEMLLEAAHCLKAGSLDDALKMLLEAALRLTGADRAFIYFRESDGALRLGAGLNRRGDILTGDLSVDLSALRGCLSGTSESLLEKGPEGEYGPEPSNLLCLQIRKTRVGIDDDQPAVWGVFYLDGRVKKCDFSSLSPDLLSAIAKGAGALTGEAAEIQIEESARRYRQELNIASAIQKELSPSEIPEVPFARLSGRNLPAREIGGDFFDVVRTEGCLHLVLADLSGKGIGATILASILRGICFTQLASGASLSEIAASVNIFLKERSLIQYSYATMVLARIERDGALEYVNCGHLPPRLVSKGEITISEPNNLPVGLIPDVKYESCKIHLEAGDRWYIFTDGITEAENQTGEMFGDDRLKTALAMSEGLENVLSAVRDFAGGTPLADDCTILELVYTG
jgi:hypothetical protein